MTLPKKPRKGDGTPNPGHFAETIKSSDVGSPIDQQRAVSEQEEARTKLAEATRNATIMFIKANKQVSGLALSRDSDGNLKGVALDGQGNEIPGTWSDVTHQFERQGGIRADHILGDKDSETFTIEELRGWSGQPAEVEGETAEARSSDEAATRPVRPTPPDFLVKMREEEAAAARRAAGVARIKEATKRFRGPGEPRS